MCRDHRLSAAGASEGIVQTLQAGESQRGPWGSDDDSRMKKESTVGQ